MKLYIITIDEVYDLEIFNHKPLAFFSKKAAEKKMKEIIEADEAITRRIISYEQAKTLLEKNNQLLLSYHKLF